MSSAGPENNPYEVTEESAAALPEGSWAESRAPANRQELLNHECAVRAVGVLNCLAGVIGIALLLQYDFAADRLVLNAILLVVGIGLATLQPWSRGAGMIVAVVTLYLAGVQLGPLFALYFLASSKGEYVFAGPYRKVREYTQSVSYQPRVLAFAVGMFLLGAGWRLLMLRLL